MRLGQLRDGGWKVNDDQDDTSKNLRKALPATDKPYTVGYGKPPIATRFKKGRSGNPRGRPKGSKNQRPIALEQRLHKIILNEAYRSIDVNEGGKTVTYDMAEAVMRSIAVNAAKGRVRAQELFMKILEHVEQKAQSDHFEMLENAIDYKRLWTKEFASRERTGRSGEMPPIHPDDVYIGYRNGVVRLAHTESERRLFAFMQEARPGLQSEIADLRAELSDNPDRETRKEIEVEISENMNALNLINQILPE